MRICENGIYRDLTEEELSEIKLQQENEERKYWSNVSYDEAVNTEIRKKYSESQEFAILRQKEEKLKEYQEYYNYCEVCKTYVKEKIEENQAI